MLRPLAEKWFRIEVRGIDNIPDEGGALVVSNHSGTVPIDALMTMVTVHDQTDRFLRPLGADLVFRLPVVAGMARRLGATLACQADAERMLTSGELVGVWPEGFKGIGKPFTERYKLQRFGRGGFVSAALRTGVPIVPLSVVAPRRSTRSSATCPRSRGCSTCRTSRSRRSSRCSVRSAWCRCRRSGCWSSGSRSAPTPTEAEAEDPMLVFNLTDQVRETIQQTLFSLLLERDSVFG
ncbi:lysophospholipid acyltransferase family protein [Nocardioides daphniae]|uniref:lysophospholipid acyltransferase family protein n=1 Tax=Nocardioides daphniae TaxID=402297 RepID=UPI001EE853D8|nr:lysophospholipid acyltransferase family protein [Nocardioides daphniae]